MNCRHIEKILPELASGEVDERTAALAHAHLASCPACASEYAGYQAAMCALAQPRESVEVPAALDVLHLPEPKRGWSWARPMYVTAALAAVLAGIMFMPKSQEPTKQTKVADNRPQHRTVLPHATTPANPEYRAVLPDLTAPARPLIAEIPKKHAQSPKRRVPHNMIALADIGTKGRSETPVNFGLEYEKESLGREALTMKSAAPASAPSRAPASESLAFDSERGMDEKPQGSVIVLACDIEDQSAQDVSEPTEISITSTDESTGATAVYEYTRDSEGREQIIETTSSRPLGS